MEYFIKGKGYQTGAIEEFKDKAEKLIEQIQNLINEMPYKGNTCSKSQKICLQKALNELEMNVNGVEKEDFTEENND